MLAMDDAASVQPEEEVPAGIQLLQNHPNPFNSTTIIPFRVSSSAGVQPVRLLIYDLQGRLVRTLLDEALSPGSYMTRWDGTNGQGIAVASGTYLCMLRSAGRSETKKLVVLR